MLALAPAAVRTERISEADDADRTHGLFFSHPVNRTSRNGVTGCPTKSSREDGEHLFGMMVADLSRQLRSALEERPPLDRGYFETL
jgi:creatinine amidohydrolase